MLREGRGGEELRPVVVHRGFTEMTPGSVLIEMGRTRVLCTVSLDADVPPWMRDSAVPTESRGGAPGAASTAVRRAREQGPLTRD